jgi:drug/metabolite transporter (DMT)-like permease
MPLFLIVIAALALGERVRWRRTTATIAGFVGVLIIVQPGGEAEWALLAPLFVGFIDAILGLVVKKASTRDGVLTIMFHMHVCTLMFFLPYAIYAWQAPTAEEALLMFAVAAISTLSQVLTVNAWRLGDATAVAPINYTQIVLIGLSGFVVYGEVPSVWTVLGAVIIAASTFYIVRREAQLRAGPTQTTSTSSTNR